MDVSKIVLTDVEQKIFDRFKRTDSAELTKEEYKVLLHKNLILDSIGGSSGWFDDLPEKGLCSLSDVGKDLRAYQAQRSKAERKSSRRYWITTGIAIAAFLLAVASLLWQAYTWRYELKQTDATFSFSFSSSVPVDPKSNGEPEAQQAAQQRLH